MSNTSPANQGQGHHERGRHVWQKCQIRHQPVSVRDIMNKADMCGKSFKYVTSQSVLGTSLTRPTCVAKVSNTSATSQCQGHHERGRHVWQVSITSSASLPLLFIAKERNNWLHHEEFKIDKPWALNTGTCIQQRDLFHSDGLHRNQY